MTLAAVALAGAGCKRSGPVPVEGVLLVDDNPLGGATVLFHPVGGAGQPASGFTRDDGSFDLSTRASQPGVYEGDYRVIVVFDRAPKVTLSENMTMADKMKAWAKAREEQKGELTKPSPVPAVYGSVATTPLRWTVEGGGDPVVLKLPGARP